MKNPLIKTSLAALMITGLAACSAVTPPNQSGMTTARNAAIGAAVGAAAGNLWGKDTEATLTGAAIGEFIARKDTWQAGKVGIGTFIGFIIGTVAKIGCALTIALTILFVWLASFF